jgi:hypothetical protein
VTGETEAGARGGPVLVAEGSADICYVPAVVIEGTSSPRAIEEADNMGGDEFRAALIATLVVSLVDVAELEALSMLVLAALSAAAVCLLRESDE